MNRERCTAGSDRCAVACSAAQPLQPRPRLSKPVIFLHALCCGSPKKLLRESADASERTRRALPNSYKSCGRSIRKVRVNSTRLTALMASPNGDSKHLESVSLGVLTPIATSRGNRFTGISNSVAPCLVQNVLGTSWYSGGIAWATKANRATSRQGHPAGARDHRLDLKQKDNMEAPTGPVALTVNEQRSLDLLPLGLCVVDRQFTVQCWNRTLEEWTGIRREGILNRPGGEGLRHLASFPLRERIETVFRGEAEDDRMCPLHGALAPRCPARAAAKSCSGQPCAAGMPRASLRSSSSKT